MGLNFGGGEGGGGVCIFAFVVDIFVTTTLQFSLCCLLR